MWISEKSIFIPRTRRKYQRRVTALICWSVVALLASCDQPEAKQTSPDNSTSTQSEPVIRTKSCPLDTGDGLDNFSDGIKIAYITKDGAIDPKPLQIPELEPTWDYLANYIDIDFVDSNTLPKTGFVYIIEFCEKESDGCLNYRDSAYCLNEDGSRQKIEQLLGGQNGKPFCLKADGRSPRRRNPHSDIHTMGYAGVIDAKLPSPNKFSVDLNQRLVMSRGGENVRGTVFLDAELKNIIGARCFVGAKSEPWIKARRISECIYRSFGFTGLQGLEAGEYNTGIFSSFYLNTPRMDFKAFDDDTLLSQCFEKLRN